MTELERQERVAKGHLWIDMEEFIAHQARVKDLMYEFNMSKQGETARRAEWMKQILGIVEKDVWSNPHFFHNCNIELSQNFHGCFTFFV